MAVEFFSGVSSIVAGFRLQGFPAQLVIGSWAAPGYIFFKLVI